LAALAGLPADQGHDPERGDLGEGDEGEVGEALAREAPAPAGHQGRRELSGEVDAGEEDPDRQPSHHAEIILGCSALTTDLGSMAGEEG
jgi:hypothetical protein